MLRIRCNEDMIRRLQTIILLTIIFLAFILRFWQLGSVPTSPDWDEAALGYNAYSIMQTGKDEYGKTFPFILRSFDDYKPALYVYLAMPFIATLGLNIIAVRLPSVIFGVLTVLASYYLVKGLFPEPIRFRKTTIASSYIGLLVAFLLALSPWHIQFSRIAFEANVGLAFNIFGILFFLYGLKRNWYLVLSGVFFALNLYVYQSEKAFVPLLVITLTLIYLKKLLHVNKKTLAIAVVLGLMIALPMFTATLIDKDALARARGVSFLSDKTPLLSESIQKLQRDKEQQDVIGLYLDNRRVVYVKTVIAGYLSHFDLNWLFIKGDFNVQRHHAPDMGLLYLIDLPFLLIGIYSILMGKQATGFVKKSIIFLFAWFLITPIPASITTGVPHAVRTLNFLPTFQIFTAFGLLHAFVFMKEKKRFLALQYILYAFYIFLLLFNVFYYLNQYFIQQNYYYARDWQYGYREMVSYAELVQHQYKKIIVSNKADMSQSHMFFLFYTKYDPKKYLAEGGTRVGGILQKGNSFSNFEFRDFNNTYEKGKEYLFIGAPGDFPEEFRVVKSVYYPDGSLAIKAVVSE